MCLNICWPKKPKLCTFVTEYFSYIFSIQKLQPEDTGCRLPDDSWRLTQYIKPFVIGQYPETLADGDTDGHWRNYRLWPCPCGPGPRGLRLWPSLVARSLVAFACGATRGRHRWEVRNMKYMKRKKPEQNLMRGITSNLDGLTFTQEAHNFVWFWRFGSLSYQSFPPK